MKIGFLGLGNLGLPMAYAFKFKGHDIYGFDINPDRMKPEWFKEKEVGPDGVSDLKPLMLKEPINYVSSMREIFETVDIVFVTVQTPNKTGHDGTVPFPKKRENYELRPLKKCFEDIARMPVGPIVVVVSTVLPGTIRKDFVPILSNTGHLDKLVHNPMFCAMGTVVPDLYDPEFVLLGADNKFSANRVAEFYRTVNDSEVFTTSFENAEMIKTCYNGFITMKINYANVLMEMAYKIPGCNCDAVMDCLFLGDKRLISTKYLRGGMGDGGGCHPKENSSLSWLAQQLNLSFDWFEMNMTCRERQTEWLADLICEKVFDTGMPVSVFGTAFKEETNLETGSPSILLIDILRRRGINPIVYDPFVERVNKLPHYIDPEIFFIAAKHDFFKDYKYPKGSIVIDPWRFIPDVKDVEVIRIGE